MLFCSLPILCIQRRMLAKVELSFWASCVNDTHRCSSGQKSAGFVPTGVWAKIELGFWTASTTAMLFWPVICQFCAHRGVSQDWTWFLNSIDHSDALLASNLLVLCPQGCEPKLNLIFEQHRPQRCPSGQKSASFVPTGVWAKIELSFWTASTTAMLFWPEICQFCAHKGVRQNWT